jgi:uncharacterized caspase-like protein
MPRLRRVLALLFCGLLALEATAAACAASERRVALVIGNSSYKSPGLDIRNARNDAQDTASALKALGFDVLLETDVDLAGASKAIQQFARMSIGADATLFYFAGHAVQYQGQNYLLPVDAEVRDEISLPFETIAVDNIRSALDRSNGIKIMVLDACRTNPVSERLARLASATASIDSGERTRGLQRVDKSDGLIVAYSTSPGDVALDGEDRNSPFTKAFLRRLNEPGLEIETMFRRIAADVSAATGGRQRPETYVSLVSEYHLNQDDSIAWDKIKGSDDPAVLNDFMERFPSSFYAIAARYRLEALQRALAAAKAQALREAEIARREKELAAQEEAQRLKAQQACESDGAALAAVGPRDADALRRLAAGACDDVKAAAQKRLSDLEATLTAEAEAAKAACGRDAAALQSIAPQDAAALRGFIANESCDAVKATASARLADLEARAAGEAALCQGEDNDLKALIGKGDTARIEALRANAHCPGTVAAAEQSLRAVAAAADGACADANSTLNGIGPRDADALRALIGKAPCGTVKTAAEARLHDAEAAIAQEAQACVHDEGEWKDLSNSTDRAAIEAFRQRAACPDVIAAIDKAVTDLKTACAREQSALAAIGPNDAEATRAFLASAVCDDAKTAARAKIAELAAQAARLEEACASEDAELTALKAQGAEGRGKLIDLKGRLTCARLRPDVEAALEQTAPAPPAAAPQSSADKLLRRPKKDNLARPAKDQSPAQKAAEPKPAKAARPAPVPAAPPARVAKPAQPERPPPQAQSTAQSATPQSTPNRLDHPTPPLGVGY